MSEPTSKVRMHTGLGANCSNRRAYQSYCCCSLGKAGHSIKAISVRNKPILSLALTTSELFCFKPALRPMVMWRPSKQVTVVPLSRAKRSICSLLCAKSCLNSSITDSGGSKITSQLRPSTITIWPSMSAVLRFTPKTAGMPKSRAKIESWELATCEVAIKPTTLSPGISVSIEDGMFSMMSTTGSETSTSRL